MQEEMGDRKLSERASVPMQAHEAPAAAKVSEKQPPADPHLLCSTSITPAGTLAAIDQFLNDCAVSPPHLTESRVLAQDVIHAVLGKFTLLRDGRYWEPGISPETEERIRRAYPDIDSFMAHQKHLAFPGHVSRSGDLLPSHKVSSLHPFSLAVLRHVASDAVKAIDLTPFELPGVHYGHDGVYSVISFGAQLGMLARLCSFFSPMSRFIDFVHEGAHHLLCSWAFDKERCPRWLTHSLASPPERLWGRGEILRSNHATLYGEVLANYIAHGGNASAAIRTTQRTYGSQWNNQFVARFPVVKRLSPEKILVGLQQLTERYPGSTWVDLQNIDWQGGEISDLLS